MGATEGLRQGLLLSVSQGLHYLLGPLAVTQASGGSSVLLSLIFFALRIRPMKTMSSG